MLLAVGELAQNYKLFHGLFSTNQGRKAIQFYLHEADEKLIREFAVWLAPHRRRINDSLVVKAVLRAAKTGPDLLAAYDEGLAVSKAHQKGREHREGV